MSEAKMKQSYYLSPMGAKCMYKQVQSILLSFLDFEKFFKKWNTFHLPVLFLQPVQALCSLIRRIYLVVFYYFFLDRNETLFFCLQ